MSLITDQFRVNKAYSGNRDEIRWKDADTLEWTRTRALLTERRPSEPMNRNVQTSTTKDTYRLSELDVKDTEHRRKVKGTTAEDLKKYDKISDLALTHVNTMLTENYTPPVEGEDQKVDVAFSPAENPEGKHMSKFSGEKRIIGQIFMGDGKGGKKDIGYTLIRKGYAEHKTYNAQNNAMKEPYRFAEGQAKRDAMHQSTSNLWSFHKKSK